jgi:hypothetical protein
VKRAPSRDSGKGSSVVSTDPDALLAIINENMSVLDNFNLKHLGPGAAGESDVGDSEASDPEAAALIRGGYNDYLSSRCATLAPSCICLPGMALTSIFLLWNFQRRRSCRRWWGLSAQQARALQQLELAGALPVRAPGAERAAAGAGGRRALPGGAGQQHGG